MVMHSIGLVGLQGSTSMRSDKKVPSLVREWRDSLLLSQEKFAELVGVSTQTLNRWEKGRQQPVAENIRALTQKLGISVDQFYNGPHGRIPTDIFVIFENILENDIIQGIARVSQSEGIAPKVVISSALYHFVQQSPEGRALILGEYFLRNRRGKRAPASSEDRD